MKTQELKDLEYAIDEITEISKGFGLDFYRMRYEICPSDIIYTFGAYGMPTRFHHWSFGKTFNRMKTQYDFGLSKIYELVINSDPCYAFLLDGNSLIQNKLIVAHVLAHCDFFKNNLRFSNTNRRMVESMAATAERIRQYEIEYGAQAVEEFLDAVLAVQEHVDPSLIMRKQAASRQSPSGRKAAAEDEAARNRRPQTAYEQLWQLDDPVTEDTGNDENKRFPETPEKDLLWFLEEYSPALKDWQRDVLTMLRDEMLYFWPQMETKIMNEGWATYWHIRILRELDLTPEETIEFAKLNAAVVQPSKVSLNPYYLGLKIFEDIEKRWDQPTAEEKAHGRSEGEGREKLFEVRELDSDTSFIRSYLTKELVEDLDLYLFEKKGSDWKITDKTWEGVRDQLVYSRVNGGFPYIVVEDGNYERNGGLYLKHEYEGIELDLKYVERTLPFVQKLWGKTVYLESRVEDKCVVFNFDGVKHGREFV